MIERPVLLKADEVRLILAGRTNVIRRPFRPQPGGRFLGLLERPIRSMQQPPVLRAWFSGGPTDRSSVEITCPYGKPGDHLWVREVWVPDPTDDGSWNYTSWAGCKEGRIAGVPEHFRKPEHVIYAADWKHDPLAWNSGVSMPRWASRLTLEVVDVQVEQVPGKPWVWVVCFSTGAVSSKPSVTPEQLGAAIAAHYPPTATCWSQATDEVREMSRGAREVLSLNDDHAVDFRALATPSAWNTKGIESIVRFYAAMSNAQKWSFLKTYLVRQSLQPPRKS